jgi:hypothetical protein
MACVAVALAVGVGCASNESAGEGENCTVNYEGDCEATKESGRLLKAFGRYEQQGAVGTPQPLRALVVQMADGNCESGGAAEGVTVDFQIITPNADATLSPSSAVTGADGIGKAEFVANEPGQYQVQASAEGTCSVNFTVEIVESYRGLDPVGADTVNAWTHTRVTLSAKAYTIMPGSGEYPLTGETVTFTLGAGGTGAGLEDLSQTQQGTEIDVTTGGNGVATVQLDTGSAPVPNGLTITASLEGTEPVEFTVFVDEYSSQPCTTNADCPIDFPICDTESGLCIENPSGTDCVDNSDCVPPYECVDVGGTMMCVQPNTSGQRCDPIEGADCPSGQVCIGGFCTDDPTTTTCTTNSDCPTGFICVDGSCVPDPDDPDPPCVVDEDCEGDLVCDSGVCVDPDGCTPVPDPTRLNGTWSYDSTLHLRDALAGWLDGFLSAFEVLRDIILGDLDLGLPGWIEDLISGAISGLIDAYVPPWAQDLIVALGDISDILDDMRVLHTVQTASTGNYEYVGTSTWDLVEFEFRGQVISEQPQNIPQIGHVPTYNFTSREICHVYFIDQHEIHNVVGGLIRWAIDAVVTAVTCSVQGWGCYYSLEEALYDIIWCEDIAWAIDDFVYDSFGVEVYDAVYAACESAKGPAIDSIIQYLDDLEVTFSVLSMHGQADIIDDNHLGNSSNFGRWYGSLGGGSWDGEFTAVKQ